MNRLHYIVLIIMIAALNMNLSAEEATSSVAPTTSSSCQVLRRVDIGADGRPEAHYTLQIGNGDNAIQKKIFFVLYLKGGISVLSIKNNDGQYALWKVIQQDMSKPMETPHASFHDITDSLEEYTEILKSIMKSGEELDFLDMYIEEHPFKQKPAPSSCSVIFNNMYFPTESSDPSKSSSIHRYEFYLLGADESWQRHAKRPLNALGLPLQEARRILFDRDLAGNMTPDQTCLFYRSRLQQLIDEHGTLIMEYFKKTGNLPCLIVTNDQSHGGSYHLVIWSTIGSAVIVAGIFIIVKRKPQAGNQ